MRSLKESKAIDWAAMGAEDLPELIRLYIEDQDSRALGSIWQEILPDWHFLTEATSRVVEFLIPLLQDEERGHEAFFLRSLAQACWAAMESPDLYCPPHC